MTMEHDDIEYTSCDEPIDDGTFDWVDYCARPLGHAGRCSILLTENDMAFIKNSEVECPGSGQVVHWLDAHKLNPHTNPDGSKLLRCLHCGKLQYANVQNSKIHPYKLSPHRVKVSELP